MLTIIAGPSALSVGAVMKISKLIKGDKRSFRIKTSRSGEPGVAATVGDICVVSVLDPQGALMAEFSEPLALTIGYTDADLAAAGFSSADAPELKLFRWNSDSGLYEFVDSSVNTAAYNVTAMIDRPGQYLLAIDRQAPVIADFSVTPGTDEPEISMSLTDGLSGVDPSTLQISLDGVTVVDGNNYGEYFDVITGALNWSADQPLAAGAHTVNAAVRDQAGNLVSQNFTFTINTSLPEITHTAPGQCTADSPLVLAAQATDDQGIQTCVLHYRPVIAETPYMAAVMTDLGGGNYQGEIPMTYLCAAGLRYYIRAVDITGNTVTTDPIDVAVTDFTAPIIPGTATVEPDPLGGFRISWDPAAAVDTAGYKVYLGPNGDTMSLHRDIGDTTWLTLDQTYENDLFSVSAYDLNGNESALTIPVSSCLAGDLNHDKKLTLADAILGLKILTNALQGDEEISLCAVLTQGAGIGLPEVIAVLRGVAEGN